MKGNYGLIEDNKWYLKDASPKLRMWIILMPENWNINPSNNQWHGSKEEGDLLKMKELITVTSGP